jgi:hypothetical protein
VQEVTSSSAVTLGDIADKLAMLEVACFPMRAARPSVANLIERHGADAQLTNLRTVLAGDCPRIGGAICEQCRVHSPQLRDRCGGTATLTAFQSSTALWSQKPCLSSYQVQRRRRPSRPKPARAVPKIAKLAGSGTGVTSLISVSPLLISCGQF